MKKFYSMLVVVCLAQSIHAQELFVYTEPASNMPAKSIGVRLTHTWMKETVTASTNYHLLPEFMLGISKQWMVHAEAFLSNRNGGLAAEGAGLYTKYRFLSNDNIHSHFRMAAYGRYSFNNSSIHQEEIETNAHNTGYELGIVATKLLHKVALSTTVSYEQASNNGTANKFPAAQSNQAINYTFSVGKLLLPKEYTSYHQTNINFMVECLGQHLFNGKSMLDIAPSVQFIINSQARIDVSYRKQLYSTMLRTAPNGFFLRLEYAFFNAWK